MKRLQWITIMAIAFVGYITISAYKEGPASYQGYDCTGAETGLGNPTGCYANSNCHSSAPTSGITLALELDSVGVPTTQYVGGMSYTIKITGTNTTTNNLPKFGFQLGSITGSTAQTTPVNAGTWQAPYPTNVHYAAPNPTYYVVGIVEHGAPLAPTTGTGGKGTTYVETINWKAPVKGTGTISIWGALNAVNNNGNADAGDKWNVDHIVLTEETPSGIAQLADNNEVRVYPNPFSMYATFSLNTEVENAVLSLYDITGREVKQLTFSGKEAQLERCDLKNGIYFYRITSQDNNILTGKVIIQ